MRQIQSTVQDKFTSKANKLIKVLNECPQANDAK